jgi:phosphoglycolate phosphatase
MKIFFDLDGTLLNSKPRLYHLFQFLVPHSKFSYEDYWKLKKDKISHREILTNYFKYQEKDIIKFNFEWMSLIESPEWIIYDEPFEGLHQFLESLNLNNQLYIVTARQDQKVVFDQIKSFHLDCYFKDILVTLQKIEKSDLIKKTKQISNLDWIIGDTGKDIETGKILGIKTAAVLTGFLSQNQLIRYSPDVILENVSQFKL